MQSFHTLLKIINKNTYTKAFGIFHYIWLLWIHILFWRLSQDSSICRSICKCNSVWDLRLRWLFIMIVIPIIKCLRVILLWTAPTASLWRSIKRVNNQVILISLIAWIKIPKDLVLVLSFCFNLPLLASRWKYILNLAILADPAICIHLRCGHSFFSLLPLAYKHSVLLIPSPVSR